MPARARIYIAFVVLAGSSALAGALANWTWFDPALFWSYLLIAMVSSVFKVALPGIKGTISMSYLFLMLGVVRLSLGETLIIGLTATLVQSFWKCKERPKFLHLFFNSSSIMLSIAGAYGAFHSPAVGQVMASPLARVFLAAAVYFFLNTWSVAAVIALTGRTRILPIWKTSYLWSFPYYLLSASIVAVIEALGAKAGSQIAFILLPVAYVVYRSYRLHVSRLEEEKARAQEEREHAEAMSALHLRTIRALALAIEAQDQTTHQHLQRVQFYAFEIGKQMGLSGTELQALQAASILHDIGKLAVPEDIISKPGRLTHEEFERMKVHPVVGAEILAGVGFPYPVTPIVRAHHERWDGSGYPDGLKGEEIPLGARILSVVDCLDALASDRQYRRALPLEKALAVIVADSGTCFDPRVVEVLRRGFLELERMAREVRAIDVPALSKAARIDRGAGPAAGYAASPDAKQIAARGDGNVPITQLAAFHEQLRTLDVLSVELGEGTTPGEVCSILGQRLPALAPFSCFAVYLRDGGQLRPAAVLGEHSDLFANLEIPVGQGLSGWVAENRKPLLNGNPSVEPGRHGDDPGFSALRSALSVPLESAAGVLGVLTLYHKDKDAYNTDHLRLLLGIRSRLALALENALSRESFRAHARTDEVTGLPNLASLLLILDGEIARSRRSGKSLAIVGIGLDRIRALDEQLGRQVADDVLRAVAASIRRSIRGPDIVARIGGDGFAVVLSGLGAAAIERRIVKLKKAAGLAGAGVSPGSLVSVSAGAAVFPSDGTDSAQLLAVTHERMHEDGRRPPPQGAETAGLPELLSAVHGGTPVEAVTLRSGAAPNK